MVSNSSIVVLPTLISKLSNQPTNVPENLPLLEFLPVSLAHVGSTL